MSADGPTAEQAWQAYWLLKASGVVHLISAAGIGWLYERVRRGCAQCPHCVDAERERQERARQATADYAKEIGLDPESERTRERLFGRRVVDQSAPEEVAHDEEAPGREDGDPRP